MTRWLRCLLVCCSCITAYGQQNFNNWYFGTNAGINFNQAPAAILNNGRLNTSEGCASISDANGALLFYTDGVTVWDKNHNQMPNGSGLTGHRSSSQSALIVPVPGNAALYYLFTVTDGNRNGDLRYSVIDIKLNNGNGDIIPSSKNSLVATRQTEKLTAASGGCGIWVLSHQRDNNRFEARLVNSDGIQPPVYTDIGAIHSSIVLPNESFNALGGMMKVSPDNRRIAVASLAGIEEIFDFDPATGQLSNLIKIPVARSTACYGICFSPDNSKIYFTKGRSGNASFEIYQTDLSAGDATAIINSETFTGRAITSGAIVGDLQTGPDKKIYITRPGTRYLAVIPFPGLKAPLCGFVQDGLFLENGQSASGLPNEIRSAVSYAAINLGKDTILCPGNTLQLNGSPILNNTWSTGETSKAITISNAGSYWVKTGSGSCIISDTINILIEQPTINLGNDTSICEGDNLALDAGIASSWLWSNKASAQTITINKTGVYWATTNKSNCLFADTIQVNVNPMPSANLGKDTVVCGSQSLRLIAGTAENYLWSDGSASSEISITTDDSYWVKMSNGNCVSTDTITVTFKNLTATQLPRDTIACDDKPLLLNSTEADSYSWSTGETTKSIAVTRPGEYILNSKYGNCDKQYTTIVKFKSCGCTPEIPSAFSPNGDGLNDIFRAVGQAGCGPGVFNIYNRGGLLVFSSRQNGKGWDGTYRGTIQAPGIYVWQMQWKENAITKTKTGTVTLIR